MNYRFKAIFANPNCTTVFQQDIPASGVTVSMGPVLDGIAPHMLDYPDDEAFRQADEEPVNVAGKLKEAGAEVLICYLPVGSEKAVRLHAEACLKSGVAMVNCVPVFIASDPEWAGNLPVPACPSSATTSRARWARPSSIACLPGCSATAASISVAPINSTPAQYRFPQHAGA